MKKNLFILLIIITIVGASGCSKSKQTTVSEPIKITAAEAKEMMDQDANVLILDVRTEEEFNEGHISGAIRIADNEILDKAEALITDKDTTILVYCRSGRRSALAAQSLVELKYTKVYDFGGIVDWPYDIIK